MLLKKFGIPVLILIPLILYIIIIFNNIANIPYHDDFYWALEFFENFFKEKDFLGKLTKLFSQHNQHRIFTFRAINLFFLQIFGEINFKYLTIAGNMFVLGIFMFFFLFLKRTGHSLLYIIPLSFWWFRLNYYSNSIQTFGVPNISVIFFAIGSFYFISQNKIKYNVLLSVLFAFLALFSNGNGIIVFPIVTAILLFQKNWKLSLGFIALTILFTGLYFTNYAFDSNEVRLNLNTVTYFFKFMGASLFPASEPIYTAISVASFLIVTFVLIKKLLAKKLLTDPSWIFITCLFLFTVGTSLMTAIVRSYHNLPISNWYTNYSILLFITLYLIFLNTKNLKKTGFKLFLFSGIILWYFSIINFYTSTTFSKNQLNADGINFHNHNTWSFLTPQVGKENFLNFNRITREFIKKGIYHLPKKEINTLELDKHNLVKYDLKQEYEEKYHSYKFSYEHTNPKLTPEFGYIYNQENNKTYFFGLMNSVNGLVASVLTQQFKTGQGLFLVNDSYFNEAIATGNYQVGITFLDDQKNRVWSISDNKILIKKL